MHNATAITTGSANQRPNTPCIRLWIDVTFRGLEDSYILRTDDHTTFWKNLQMSWSTNIILVIKLELRSAPGTDGSVAIETIILLGLL